MRRTSREPETTETTSNGLPGATRAKMEGAFDASFANVRVHEGAEAPAIGAQAYTQGADIHFAPGAYAPGTAAGDQLIGHELAHVVQQREGRVGATTQAKGLEVNDDDHLEREADSWGDRAARGEPVGRDGGARASAAPGAVQKQGVVQRAPVDSHQGKFLDTEYAKTARGVSMVLEFKPGPTVDATKIGLTQSVNYSVGGKPNITDPTEVTHVVPDGKPGAGSMIDRITTNTNPIYGSKEPGTGKLEDTVKTNAPEGEAPTKDNARYRLGHHFKEGEAVKEINAWMYDKPEGDGTKNSSMEFETTAVAIDGKQKGTYYGSVKWGWKTDGSGKVSEIPFALVSAGVPSSTFLSAAETWNKAKARGTIVTTADDTPVYDDTLTEKFKVGKDTVVEVDGAAAAGGVVYESVTIKGGPKDGRSGYIKLTSLKDKGDGKDTLNLPTPDVHLFKAEADIGDGKTWPKGTRVVKTGTKVGEKVGVRAVQGEHTGKEGSVDPANLQDELT